MGVGCGNADGGPREADEPTAPAPDQRVAVEPDVLRGPGTELAEGVEVQEGSSLVATTFPVVDMYEEEPSSETAIAGWTALLVVDGDPLTVWDRYATELGIDDVADAVHACVVTTPYDTKPDPDRPDGTSNTIQDYSLTRLVTEQPIPGEDLVDCEAVVNGTSARLVAGAQRCETDQAAPGVDCATVGAAHLWITVGGEEAGYQRLGTDEILAARSLPGSPDAVQPETVPDDESPIVPADIGPGPFGPPLAAAGEPWDAGLDPYLGLDGVALVPDGGRQLVAPAILTPCSGAVTVLQLPGAPTEAIEPMDGAVDDDDPLQLHRGADFGGRAWAGGEITTAGGYYVSQTAVDAGDGTSWVFVSECGD
jgi:hypothetical protein